MQANPSIPHGHTILWRAALSARTDPVIWVNWIAPTLLASCLLVPTALGAGVATFEPQPAFDNDADAGLVSLVREVTCRVAARVFHQDVCKGPAVEVA